MKKALALLLALVMVLGLAACGGGSKPTETKPAETKAAETKAAETKAAETKAAETKAAETKAEEPKAAAGDAKVGVFYYTFADTYISSVRAAMDEKLTAAGLAFENFDGNGDQKTQSEQVTTALAKGVNVLVVNLVETSSADAAQEIVDQAKAQKVPVIFFNREVASDVVKSYEQCAFVGTDAAEAGHMQGAMIGDYLLKDYDKYDLNKDGEISYLLFKGQMGNPEADFRTQFGVEDADAKLVEAKKPALKFYDSSNSDKFLVDKNGQWSATAAKEYMDTILPEYNDANKNMIELIICNNDGMAEGAISGLEGVGYNKEGGDKTIPVFGVDATDAAKDLIAKGIMAGTVKQDAAGMAEVIVKLVGNVAAGKPVLDNTSDLNIDADVAKVRIPYQVYLGE